MSSLCNSFSLLGSVCALHRPWSACVLRRGFGVVCALSEPGILGVKQGHLGDVFCCVNFGRKRMRCAGRVCGVCVCFVEYIYGPCMCVFVWPRALCSR